MVVRTAKRGANAGNLFWGCLTYPSCKGTRHRLMVSHATCHDSRPDPNSPLRRDGREFFVHPKGSIDLKYRLSRSARPAHLSCLSRNVNASVSMKARCLLFAAPLRPPSMFS